MSDVRQYEVSALGERRFRTDEKIFGRHGYTPTDRLTAADDPLFTVIYRRQKGADPASPPAPMPARKTVLPTIAVLAMAPDRGLTLGFRCTAAEFKRLLRPYTDDPVAMLAEAKAWPMCTRMFGGEVYAHGLEAAPGEKPWRESARSNARVTLTRAPAFASLKPTYQILTRAAFITAMAPWWTETAEEFDWMVENRSWLTANNVTAYGAPLVWVEDQDRDAVVEQLVRLRDDRLDFTVAADSYDAWQKDLLASLVQQLPETGGATVSIGDPRQWPMRLLLGVPDESEAADLAPHQVDALRALGGRINPDEDLLVSPDELRALRTRVSCVDCSRSLPRGEAWWYYGTSRCEACEEVEAPSRAERYREHDADMHRRVENSLDRAYQERIAQQRVPRPGIGLGTAVAFLIGREIGRKD